MSRYTDLMRKNTHSFKLLAEKMGDEMTTREQLRALYYYLALQANLLHRHRLQKRYNKIVQKTHIDGAVFALRTELKDL